MKKYTTIKDLQLLSESVLESSLAGFWDWNMVTNEEYLITRFKEMFGYSNDEMENTPESWQKIAFQEDLPGMFESFDAHVKSRGKIPFNSIVRYHHKNGNTIWIRCNGKVVEWSEKNEPLRAIGCHVDITEEKEIEFRLKKAINERDILLKEVHHRVKNNLQLLLSLSRLKDKNGRIETHEIEDSINSIARAYEAIYQSESLEKICIKEYLGQIIDPISKGQNFKYVIEAISYERNIDFLIPIGLIMTELVNNSLKHGRIGNNELEVTISVKKEGEILFIKFRDNGKGYGEKFNPSEERSSFGLNIIEGLVDQLSGSIRFFDEKGACAETRITLP
jgi:two-component system CheB/CheR fusion protein